MDFAILPVTGLDIWTEAGTIYYCRYKFVILSFADECMSQGTGDLETKRPCVEILDEAIVRVLRSKTPAERIAMVFDAERTMRLMLRADLIWRHPDWSEQRVIQETARRFCYGSG